MANQPRPLAVTTGASGVASSIVDPASLAERGRKLYAPGTAKH